MENVRQGDPQFFRAIDLHSGRLVRVIERSRERRYFVVPLPVADYDAAIAEVSGSAVTVFGLSAMEDEPTSDYGDGGAPADPPS